MAKKRNRVRQNERRVIKKNRQKQLEQDFFNKKLAEFDPETGEIYEDEQYTLYEWAIIQGFYDRLSDFNPDFTLKLREWVEHIIENYGISSTAKMLEKGADNGLIVDKMVVYKATQQQYYLNSMINYLPDVVPITKQYTEDLAEQMFLDIDRDEFWL